jgi:hypothetical protein
MTTPQRKKRPPEKMGPRGAKDAIRFRERLVCHAPQGEPLGPARDEPSPRFNAATTLKGQFAGCLPSTTCPSDATLPIDPTVAHPTRAAKLTRHASGPNPR